MFLESRFQETVFANESTEKMRNSGLRADLIENPRFLKDTPPDGSVSKVVNSIAYVLTRCPIHTTIVAKISG